MENEKLGLKGIALFEALKGTVVLIIGFGLVPYIHQDVHELSERFVHFLNLNPAHRLSGIFLHLIEGVPQIEIMWIAVIAFVYSGFRLTEAYGLWRQRVWAEWLAIISTGLYLPLEFFELFHRFGFIKLGIVIFNLLILGYLVIVRLRAEGTDLAM